MALRYSLFLAVLTGCTTFATPRSAEVRSGTHFSVQASVATPPGDEAAWFWSFECATDCNQSVGGLDLNLTRGTVREDGRGRALGGGLNGTQPYLEGYWQLRRGEENPWGVGGRLGLWLWGWHEHRLFLRYDRVLPSGPRVLINPGIFLHTGNSPNGANPGTVLAFSQAVGLEVAGGGVRWIPAVALILGGGNRGGSTVEAGSFRTAFMAASLSAVF